MPGYDDLHRANILRYSNQIEAAYNRVIDQFARMANDPSARFSSAFSFKNEYLNKAGKMVPNDKLSTLADKYTSQFAKEVEQIISQGIEAEWSLSNQKNNALVQQHITNANVLKVNPALAEGYSIDVLRAFAKRQIEGINLSSRVWNIAQGLKFEMEAHMALGIANGDSAQVISKRVRQYLGEPDKLFRRVRNEAGDLMPSTRMKEFKPGQGVYRSSYKNAMRLARTEANTAYLTADFERWNEIDFIVGVRISLSNRHPAVDICDDLKGDYPKEFKFTGWHPQCLCTATPIMLDDDEFDEYEDAVLSGEKYGVVKSKHYVKDVPSEFKSWRRSNRGRVAKWKSTPNFIKDNPQYFWTKK